MARCGQMAEADGWRLRTANTLISLGEMRGARGRN